MGNTVHSFEIERMISAHPRHVWALISDSDRNDRVLNAPEVAYHYEDTHEAGERVRLRIGQAAMPWGETQWQERGGWIEGDWFLGKRCMTSGPVAAISLEAKTHPSPADPNAPDALASQAHTRLWIRFEVEARDSMDDAFMTYFMGRMKARMERLLDGFVGALSLISLPAVDLTEPAAASIRRLLTSLPYDALLLGPRQPTDTTELSQRLDALRAAGCPPIMADALASLLLNFPDDQLAALRPFEWAAQQSHPDITPRLALIAMLEATRAGLLDLQWQLICPSCRVSAGTWSDFQQATPSAHCVECDRAFALDMAQNVEAIFRPHEALRKAPQKLYCGGSPRWRPHITALLTLDPGETRQTSLSLPPTGEWITHALRRGCVERIILKPGMHMAITLHGGDIPFLEVTTHPELDTELANQSRCHLTLTNAASSTDDITIERADYEPRRALGVEMLTLPTFQRLFGAQAPTAGHELSVSALTVLFTDLKASTALYVALGDARAFAIVQQHFGRMQEITTAHHGTVVKTIGDAVMAVFPKMTDALDAARAMIEDTHSLHAHHDLALRVGLYEGPCLVVRANGVFDYFGTTVNMAARLQAVAEPDEMAIHAEQFTRADVQRWYTQHPSLSSGPKTVYLRGLGEHACVVLR